mmetsp:Transcript_14016/g.35106  ORF Transcript_14016/g.35106 Transcript_14016/m.35106 type:complete len:410 (+) Transcript_14016:717-1946(+)
MPNVPSCALGSVNGAPIATPLLDPTTRRVMSPVICAASTPPAMGSAPAIRLMGSKFATTSGRGTSLAKLSGLEKNTSTSRGTLADCATTPSCMAETLASPSRKTEATYCHPCVGGGTARSRGTTRKATRGSSSGPRGEKASSMSRCSTRKTANLSSKISFVLAETEANTSFRSPRRLPRKTWPPSMSSFASLPVIQNVLWLNTLSRKTRTSCVDTLASSRIMFRTVSNSSRSRSLPSFRSVSESSLSSLPISRALSAMRFSTACTSSPSPASAAPFSDVVVVVAVSDDGLFEANLASSRASFSSSFFLSSSSSMPRIASRSESVRRVFASCSSGVSCGLGGFGGVGGGGGGVVASAVASALVCSVVVVPSSASSLFSSSFLESEESSLSFLSFFPPPKRFENMRAATKR